MSKALPRLKKELDMLYREPPPGISAWAKEDGSFEVEAGARARPSAGAARALLADSLRRVARSDPWGGGDAVRGR